MSKYVPDISTRRWVIISPQRLARPEDTENQKPVKHICPFCPNHESETPPEVMRFGGGESNKPGWKLRVIPNKYAVTDLHEVIIHSPDHEKDIENLPLEQVELIFEAYKERYNFYRKKGQVLIFCNHGEQAGASLKHPHSQIVVVPSQINLDAIVREPINNQVASTKYFNEYCPDFSQWPYEVWVSPKKTNSVYGDITSEELKELAKIVHKLIKRIDHIFQRHKFSTPFFGYNYYIYPKENWYLRIIPRFVNRAGFELGTGLYVNIVDPLEAALELKGVEKKMMGVLSKLKKY